MTAIEGSDLIEGSLASNNTIDTNTLVYGNFHISYLCEAFMNQTEESLYYEWLV
jgi:hypothetical protein